MATYTELFDLKSNDALKNKITVAVVVKANALISAVTPTASEITWADNVLSNPSIESSRLINYVLAANKSATVAQISSATDSAIQTNVDEAVDAIIGGGTV